MSYQDKNPRTGKPTGLWVGERDIKGKPRFKRRFNTKKLADGYEVYVKLMGEEPPGLDNAAPTGRTFAEVAELCQKAGGPKGKWKRKRDPSQKQRLDRVVAVLGHHDIGAIKKAELETLVADLEKRPVKPGHPMKPSTINRYLASAAAVLTYAYEAEIIDRKPKIQWLPEEPKLQGVIRPDQEETILGILERRGLHVVAVCVRVLVETGLRVGELCKQLTRDQIEIETLPDQTENGYINLEGGQTKNGSARRVYLRADLAKELRAIMAAGAMPNGYQLLRYFKQAVKVSGGAPNLVIHSLRHTRNTRLRKKGVDPKVRMKMLGHKTHSASDRYDHVDTDDQLEAAKRLENVQGEIGQKGEVVVFQPQTKVL